VMAAAAAAAAAGKAACFFDFIVKRAQVDMLTPNNNRGVTYQTDEKNLNNMSEYSVGVVNLVFNRYNNRFFMKCN